MKCQHDVEKATLSSRSFRLPGNAMLDSVSTTCRKGILTVTVLKAEDARPGRIEIGVGTLEWRVPASFFSFECLKDVPPGGKT